MEEVVTEALASVKEEDIAQDHRPFLVIYKDGKIHRLIDTQTVPPSVDSATGVESQDMVVVREGGVWVRLYKPPQDDTNEGPPLKRPLLVYFHGGGFTNGTAASPMFHNYLNNLGYKAKVIVVSVDYRWAPEYPLPIAYEDSWAAIEWAANGPDHGHPWIRDHADMGRLFLGGDSAGANIAHHMAKRLGKGKGNANLILKGVLLVHPYFWGKERIGSEGKQKTGFVRPDLAGKLWGLVCPKSSGLDDPLINPGMDQELRDLGGEKVMVWVAEKDTLRDRGYYYKEVVVKSGCKASVEVTETPGEDHNFHLINPNSPNATPFIIHGSGCGIPQLCLMS